MGADGRGGGGSAGVEGKRVRSALLPPPLLLLLHAARGAKGKGKGRAKALLAASPLGYTWAGCLRSCTSCTGGCRRGASPAAVKASLEQLVRMYGSKARGRRWGWGLYCSSLATQDITGHGLARV